MRNNSSKSSSRGAPKARRGDLIILLLLALFSNNIAYAKNNKEFSRVITPSSKLRISDIDDQIPRTDTDKAIDEMISGRLGANYRRANIYDFYPLELSPQKARGMDHKEQRDLMDYYDYARKDLQKLNQSKFLKSIKLDFNLDGTRDYAVIVHELKSHDNYLSVINRDKTLYLEPFEEDYLELVNGGRYPTTLIYKKGRKRMTVSSPTIRLVSFSNDSKVFYYDKPKQKWQTLDLEDDD